MSRRKCIFTGEESNYKLTIEHEDHHNWAKSVPTTKEYYEAWLKDRPLNELELRQVELFFQLEMCKIKQSTLEKRMEKIREQIADGMESFNTVEKLKFYKPDIKFNEEMEKDIKEKVEEQRVITVTEKDWDKLQDHLENPPEPTPKLIDAMKRYKELHEDKKDDKIEKKVVKKKPTLWD